MGDGPFDMVPIADGALAPLYLLRFDKQGDLRSPRAARHLTEAVADGATDVFVFSHGWNNVFATALERYRHFVAGFAGQRQTLGLPADPKARPILVGVIWPSTKFVWPWESGPEIAAGTGSDDERDHEFLTLISDELDALGGDADEFVELVAGRDVLDDADSKRVAELLIPLAREQLGDMPGVDIDAAGLRLLWSSINASSGPTAPVSNTDFGGGPVAVDDAPQAAGQVDRGTRNLLRMGTLWSMKGRAGRVGAVGVSTVLGALLGAGDARVHCAGHSFGARVVLSAIAAQPLPRHVRSVLLLQPAVNRWCFAQDVLGRGQAGGYHVVLDRVELPILSTYSADDRPLHDVFHLVVRGKHVGEPDIAAIGDTDQYGALGGYGPAGLGDVAADVGIKPPGEPYDLGGGHKVIALEGTGVITNHGDISNKATWWALHNLLEDRS